MSGDKDVQRLPFGEYEGGGGARDLNLNVFRA